MVHDVSSPKRLSPWAPFEVPAKIEAWLREHREVRLVADEDRGGYRLQERVGKVKDGTWTEGRHYGSQVDMALAHGIITAAEAKAYREACRG